MLAKGRSCALASLVAGGARLSTNFPVTDGAAQTTAPGNNSAFVAKLVPDGGEPGDRQEPQRDALPGVGHHGPDEEVGAAHVVRPNHPRPRGSRQFPAIS